MIIQDQMAGSWSVLPGPSRERCGMGPNGLNGLAMSHPYAIHVEEIEPCLARRSVADDVELGNRDTE